MAETCYCTDTCGLRGCTSGHTPWCHGGCFQLSVKGKTPALTSQIQHPLIFVPSLESTAAARISTLSIQCVFTLQSVHLQLLLLFFPTCFLSFFLDSFSSLWMNPNGVIYVYTCAYSLCICLLWTCACLWARRKGAPGGVRDKSRCKCIQITFTHRVVVCHNCKQTTSLEF